MAATQAVTAAVRAYEGQPRGVRFHVAVRARTCPFVDLVERVPAQGRVLDLGCGHGVLALALAIDGPGREVMGVDIDDAKVATGAKAAAAAGIGNVELRAVPPGWSPASGAWDAVVLADVLYLLGVPAATKLLAQAAAGLAPGGMLLVKEIDTRPAWKYQLARLQELVSTRVTRITKGEGVQFLPPPEIARVMAGAGLHVEQVPLQRGRLHPHHLVIGRRS